MPGREHDPEELLRYDGFIRALARDLTGGAQDAEDLAQDAWVAALNTRARGNPARTWGGWLAGTMQRMAAGGRRGAARRRSREQRVAAADALPSTAEIVAREEARRRVVEAVLALEAPARDVVLLRYFENLPPREIARRLGLPVETVRTRTRRALERLRAQLDERHGGHRAHWAAALLPLSNMPSALPAGSLALMSAKTKTLAAALLLLVLAFLFLSNWPAKGDARAQDPALAAAAPATGAAAEGAAATPGNPAPVTEISRSEVPGAPAAEPAATSTMGGLRVEVRRELDASPAPDQWVHVHTWGGPHPYYAVLKARTDERGVAVFPEVPVGEVSASLHRSSEQIGMSGGTVRPGEETTIELQLPRGITLDGEVVDLAGAPVADAEIWLSDEGNLYGGHAVAQSDRTGRFILEGVGAGHWIGARKAGHSPSVMPMVLAAEGATLPVRLILQGAGGAIRGLVKDANGAPVAGAAVLIGSEEARPGKTADGKPGLRMPGARLTTDRDGGFAAEGLEPGSTEVQVRAAGWGLWRGTTEISAAGTAELEVRLEAGVRVHGRVTEDTGQPAARAWVSNGEYGIGSFSTRAAEDGSFLLEGLPSGAIRLLASDPGEEHEATASFNARPGEELVWNPVLGGGAELRVLVLDETGAPRAGCSLQITGQVSDGQPHVDFRSTDQNGRASFNNCPDQAFELTVLPPGDHFFPVARLRDLRAGGDEIEIRLDRASDPSVRIRGRLLMPDGKPAEAATLVPSFGIGSAPILMPDPATGDFALGPYPPGGWQLWVRHPVLPDHVFGPKDLAPGETWDLGEVQLAAGGTLVAVFGRGVGTQGKMPFLNVLQGARANGRVLEFTDDVARSQPIAPGDYVLTWVGEGISSGSAPFTIRSGAETVLNLALTAGFDCPLVVEEAEASELRNVELLVRDESGAVVFTEALFRGWEPEFRHALRLAPGAYRIEVRAADGRRAESALQVGAAGGAGEMRLTLRAKD